MPRRLVVVPGLMGTAVLRVAEPSAGSVLLWKWQGGGVADAGQVGGRRVFPALLSSHVVGWEEKMEF